MSLREECGFSPGVEGRRKTGAELLLQALEYLLEGGERQTDTDTESIDEGRSYPLSPP